MKGNTAAESVFIGQQEICEIVGCSKSRAYKYIRQMNEELEKKGYLTFPGRVPRRYFMERFALADKEENENAKNDRSAGRSTGSAGDGVRKHRRSSYLSA